MRKILSVGFQAPKLQWLYFHMLIERGELTKRKVTKYWPEYGKWKEETTVEMILNHSAGILIKNKSKKVVLTITWFNYLKTKNLLDTEKKLVIT